MIVTPKEIPVRHNGRRYVPGEEFEIDRAGYERIAGHLKVINEEDQLAEDKPIDRMTVPELRAYAKLHGIDLDEATKKDEILALILSAGDQVGAAGGDE